MVVIAVGAIIWWMASYSGSSSSSSDFTATSSDASTSSTYEDAYGSSDCTSDCSGHDAGYEWAQANDITETDYDAGKSDSFNEGVRAYAEENQ